MLMERSTAITWSVLRAADVGSLADLLLQGVLGGLGDVVLVHRPGAARGRQDEHREDDDEAADHAP